MFCSYLKLVLKVTMELWKGFLDNKTHFLNGKLLYWIIVEFELSTVNTGEVLKTTYTPNSQLSIREIG